MKCNYTDDEIDFLYKENKNQFIPSNYVWRNIEDLINSNERTYKKFFFNRCIDFYKNSVFALTGEPVLLLRIAVMFFAITGFVFAGIGYVNIKSGLKSENQYKSAMKDIKEAEKLYKKARASLLLLAKEKQGNMVAINSVMENINIIDNAIAEVKSVYEKQPENKELLVFIGTMYYEQTNLLVKTNAMLKNIDNLNKEGI